MKTILTVFVMILFQVNVLGQIMIATTEDGRRVLLKDDNTWEFIDKLPLVSSKDDTATEFPDCNLPDDYEEPKGNRKIRTFLKMTDATADDLKKHVAVDNDCSVDDIKIISISEQRGNGNYVLCVKGKEMRYRRTGSVFHRQGDSPVGKY